MESKTQETSLRRPGIEPRSTAWRAALLATTPPTLPYSPVDNIASILFQLLVYTQTYRHCRRGENCKNCIIKAVAVVVMYGNLDSLGTWVYARFVTMGV